MQKQYFIYGALSYPEIQRALLGKELQGKEASLNGYDAVQFVINNHYSQAPVLQEDERADVEGVLTSSITDEDLKLIKKYAGRKYILKDVYVVADGELECATTFMPKWDKLKPGPHWDKERFEKEFLRDYARGIKKDH